MWHRFFKLLHYIVLLVYVVAGATLVAVLQSTEWHPQLLHFLYRVWLAFLAHVGSTGPGFISPIILAVLSIIGTMVCVGYVQGASAMVKHWSETALYAGVVLVTTMLLVYGPQFIWQIVRVAQQDHQLLAGKNVSLTADNKDLHGQLSNAQQNAEAQCEQAKGQEIKRLKKQLTTVCFNPDRRLGPMEKEQLFSALKKIRIEMERQKQKPDVRLNGFWGDPEIGRFAALLMPVFQNAGWNFKIIPYSPNPADVLKAKTEQEEQEKWLLTQGLVEGVMVFDKNWPKGFGMSVTMAFSQAGLTLDWTQANREQTKELPHLDVMTVWIGHKPVSSSQ